MFFTFWYTWVALTGWTLHVRTWEGDDLANPRTPSWSGFRAHERIAAPQMALELSEAFRGASYCPLTEREFHARYTAARDARNAADLATRCRGRAWEKAA